MSVLLMLAVAAVPSSPNLGIAEGRCRAGEPGPAFLVNVQGLHDRQGRIKLEVYPSNNQDFLADDNVLINAGKVFRRVDVPLPASGPVQLCIRVPQAGAYSLMVLHDRDSNHRFGLSGDGIGFGGNPRLRWGRPSAAETRVAAGPGITRIDVVINYRRGMAYRPLGR
ncbi:DUF2141 domain-containing protein [Allosphingosinicella sp.]|uniref:DUF2141 domain-containing protein n=1 Tax=Allosphingosinicella sp. TaxID=2823234 RepID=UPI003784D183